MGKNHILVVDDEQSLREVLRIIFEENFPDVSTVLCASVGEAKDCLDKYSDQISIIVSDFKMPIENGDTLYQYNKDNFNIPFILMSGVNESLDFFTKEIEEESVLNTFIKKPIDYQDLLKAMRRVLSKTISDEDGNKDYSRIEASLVTKHFSGEYDLFLKVAQSKYVKFFNKNEDDYGELIKKYREKGEEYFYILKDDFPIFAQNLLKNTKSFKTLLDLLSSCEEILQLSKDDIQKIDSIVDSISGNLVKSKSLVDKIRNFGSSHDYYYGHSKLALYTSYYILKQMSKSDEETFKKFVYAVLMHDICLETRELSSIKTVEDRAFQNLPQKLQQEVLSHAKRAADIVEQFPSIPSAVISMVQHHHERPNGEGFPDRINHTRIDLFSAVFIIALEVADFLFKNWVEDLSPLVDHLDEHFTVGKFEDPAKMIIACLK